MSSGDGAIRKKSPLLGHLFAMTGASVSSKAVGMVQGLILAKILGPGGYGALNGLLLVTTYSSNSHLGALNAMSREMPIAIGAGQREKAEEIRALSLGIAVATACLVAIGVLLAAFFWQVDLPTRIALAIIALLVISQQMATYLQTVAAVEMKFNAVAGMRFAVSVAQLLFCVGLGIPFGVAGVVTGLLVGQTIVLLAFWGSVQPSPGIRFWGKRLFPLLKLGISLLWLNSLYTLLMSVDRVFILKWLGKEALGFYALGLVTVSLMAFVPGALGQVLSPRIMRSYGQGGGKDRLAELVQQPILTLGLLLPVMGGFGAVLLPLVIAQFLPAFAGAVLPGQILLLSYTPFAARSFAGEALLASDLLGKISRIQVVGLALAVAAHGTSIYMGWGIIGIACGTGLVYWFFGLTIVVTALRSLNIHGGKIGWFLLKAFLPTVWVDAWIAGGFLLLKYYGITATSLQGTLWMVALFSLSALPLLFLGWRKYRRLTGGQTLSRGATV